MLLQRHPLWCALITLEVFVCCVLAQISPSPLDMTSATQWTKCVPINYENKLRTIPLIPFHTCQKECGLRASCVGVNYWPRGKVCDLLSSISGLESNVLYGKPCIHVAAPVTHIDKCECSRNKVCDPESGTCGVKAENGSVLKYPTSYVTLNMKTSLEHRSVLKEFYKHGAWLECPVPHVSNATLRGNMNAVGSKVKVICASGYLAKLPMICEQTGNWSNFVECGCPDPCPALSYATLQPGGAHVNDIRKYKCKPGYTTPEGELQYSVTCLDDQKWSTPTTYCGKAIGSDVGPTGYVTIGCQILKLFNYSTNHSQASDACALYGNLVRIDSAEKQEAIESYVNVPTLRHGYWIQGTKDESDGVWKFDDGSPMGLAYTKWGTTRPIGNYKLCVRLSKSYYWRDAYCPKLAYRAMCELLELQ